MTLQSIDLNCDLGEGLAAGDDDALMPWLSSCNIACGGHAGDDDTMARAVDSARRHEVAVGAHPGYPDRGAFGRRSLRLPLDDLRESVYAQSRRLASIAEAAGSPLRHLKLHGALYHDAAHNPSVAAAVLDAVVRLDRKLLVFGIPDSHLERQAAARNLPFVGEAFADRRYLTLDRLRPRSQPGAVLSQLDEVLRQVEALVERREVETDLDGVQPVNAATICVHGDTPGAERLLAAIRAFLKERDVAIHPPG